MDNMKTTQVYHFSCCYLVGTELHSYRYRVHATVECPQRFQDIGYVLEFTEFKNYLKLSVPDKSFLWSNRNIVSMEIAKVMDENSVKNRACNYDISAEKLCEDIATKLQEILDFNEPGVRVTEIKLYETSESCAIWSRNLS